MNLAWLLPGIWPESPNGRSLHPVYGSLVAPFHRGFSHTDIKPQQLSII